MRKRSGPRTEHAHRKSLTVLVSAMGATAALLVVAPAGAARPGQQPGSGPGEAQPPVPVGGDSARPVAVKTDTEVNEIDVPKVAVAKRSRQMASAGKEVVARLRRSSTTGFAMVGVTWRNNTAPADVEVRIRTHSDRGWSRWQELHHHGVDGPAADEEPGSRGGTEPLWVGEADGVEARIYSGDGTAPRDLEVTLVDPGSYGGTSTAATTNADSSTQQAPTVAPAVLTGPSTARTATTVSTSRPRLVSRRAWGADPRFRSHCDSPRRANTLKMAFVHHTAGSNSYSRSDSPAIVRSVYAYHTQGRGWCDIGYNFLVDKYGTAYVGRAGGPNVPVRGAHAGDYNTGSSGISLMGNFEERRPTRAMKRKLTHLLAWKLSSFYLWAHKTTRLSGKRLDVISGHRDAMSTACPGRYVYNWLPRLRRRVGDRVGRVKTPIFREWRSQRRQGTPLGQPYRGEAAAPRGGRKTQFGRGWVFWDKGPGAHPVRGAILNRFRSYGGVGGRLRYPRTDVWRTKAHRGTGQSFQSGRIYRHPKYGTNAVWGKVNRRYARTGLADGRLGVPVRNQYRIRGGWAARFQHGRITWDTSTGRTRVYYN